MESTLLKAGKNEWFATIGFLIMDSSFKILYATVAMIWKFCLYISDIDIMTVKNIDYGCIIHVLTNLKKLIYQKILCLKIVTIYKNYISKKSILKVESATMILIN